MEAMTEAQARQFLEEAPVAHMGVSVGGVPYVSPMSFVVDGNRVMFRTMPGRRLSALEANPAVSIEACRFDEESGDWASVIVSGRAELVTDDATRQLVMGKLFEKYRSALGSPLSRSGFQPLASLPGVVVVDIEEISGMTSSGLFSQRTRPGRL
jgi:nitroimidazol reductase NimA-like FMN-containing flavoprotein (pyridoxamine 5'-phosphate oxidase superfamily)